VVSKDEVAVDRKGSGGAWGSTSRNAGGWQGQPCKMVEYEHWRKIKRKGRSLGCGLQFGGAENDLLAIRLQSSKTHFSAARTSNSRCLVLYLVQRRDARVILFRTKGCPEQRPRAALKPQEPRSSGPWTPDPGRPRPRRGRRGPRSSRVVESWSWSRGKW
jgi:hypothetical protein